MHAHTDNLRVVFAGTPEFAVEVLRGLVAAGFDIPAVFTQPDRPAGRGRKQRPSAVKEEARRLGISVLQPERIDPAVIEKVNGLRVQVVAVAAYGLILPADFLDAVPLGCVNLHASVLPRWRGAAPIQRAIIAGDGETGVTVMQMDEGLDTGDILDSRTCPILPGDTAKSLHARLAALGRDLLPRTLRALARGDVQPQPQDPTTATYASRLSKKEALLDWEESADLLERRVRAYNPWPIAYCFVGETRLRIWEAVAIPGCGGEAPGVITEVDGHGVVAATGEGGLRLERVQLAGARPVAARDLVNAGRLRRGTKLYA